MNVVRTPADFADEGRAILNKARRDMSETLSPRLRKQIEQRAAQRVEELITLAAEPAILRHAEWEHRRGHQASPYRYRMTLIPGAGEGLRQGR